MGASQSQPKEDVVDTQNQSDPIQTETTQEVVTQDYTSLDYFWPII